LPQYHVIATCVRITRYNLELQPMPTLTQAFRNPVSVEEEEENQIK
jgi:hypothetical protein